MVEPLSRGVELILGGQKSGKSRRAEHLAAAWLALPPCQGQDREAMLIATAHAWDEEMAQRIARHQADRAQRVPGLRTLEEPQHLAACIAQHSAPHRLLVVDCLTLWLTNWLMPMEAPQAEDEASNFDKKTHLSLDYQAQIAHLLIALQQATGPVVLVGNEIGLGVIPLGREVRAFVDALGRLNQDVATVANRVVLMVAGCPLVVKSTPAQQAHENPLPTSPFAG